MKRKKFKFLILLGVTLCLSSAAWAAGIYFHCNAPVQGGTAFDHSGAALQQTSLIQVVYGGPGAPDPAKARFLHSGTWQADRYVGAGTSTNGKFDFQYSSTQSTYLRIWENGGPARGSYYRTLGGYTPGDPLPAEIPIGDFSTNYLADVPPAPTVSAGGFKLTWDSAKEAYLVDFTLTATPARTPNVEVVSYSIRVRKEADDWTAGKVHTGGATWNITEDPANPYFIAGGWYVAVASASNYFPGSSGWGTDYRFQIPTGGGPGGEAGPVTYVLRKIPEGLGLNAVSVVHEVPFNVDTDPATPVGTIADLVRAINTKSSSPNNVTAIGLMVESAMQGFYVTYPDGRTATYTPTGGIAADANVPLKRGESYQISVNSSVEVTFSQ